MGKKRRGERKKAGKKEAKKEGRREGEKKYPGCWLSKRSSRLLLIFWGGLDFYNCQLVMGTVSKMFFRCINMLALCLVH